MRPLPPRPCDRCVRDSGGRVCYAKCEKFERWAAVALDMVTADLRGLLAERKGDGAK